MQTLPIYAGHIISKRNITIAFDAGEPVQILSTNPQFERIAELLRDGYFEEAVDLADVASRIVRETKGKFTVVNGNVEIDGELLPDALSNKLIEFVEHSLPTEPLERFWDNLKENPTDSARQDLFSFLEANRVALTADGCFIAYKKVRDDWMDSYTGKTHRNKPGDRVSMDRESVDADRRNTCSAGLHVAAWEYASTFSGERILEVKINPKDVVAVPPDYNQQKMRVCEYLVIRQTDKPYDGSIYEDVMADLTQL